MKTSSIGSLIDLSSDALVETDRELNIVSYNRKFGEFFGTNRRNLYEIIPESYHKVVRKLISQSSESLSPLSVKLPVMDKQGKRSIFFARIVPVERGFYISLIPETKASLSEEIVNALEYGILLVSNEGEIIYQNNYAKQFAEYIPEIIKHVLSDENIKEVKVQGRIFEVSSKSFKRRIEGKIVFFRDITETRKMEELMSMVDRLYSIGLTAASLAHEIKNPLTSIKVLAQTLADELSNDKKEIALRIARQIDRVNELISKLLLYTKPSKSKPTYVKVRNVVQEVVEVLQGYIDKKKLNVKLNIPDNIEILVDPKDLHQILMNLLLNSIEATPENGTIIVEVGKSNIFPSDGKIEPYFYIKVKDTGVGIPKNKLKDIFLPFYTTKKSGTGIGLFVVHKLVRDNNGMIEVESDVGKGAEFTLYFKGRVRDEKGIDSG